MNAKPIILVTGTTGAMGAAVARSLLKSRKYSVRILVPDKESQPAKIFQRAGAEIFGGSLENSSTLVKVMKGVYGVFGITDFWKDYAREYQLGINLADAVKETGVKHFVLVTQPDYYKLSEGKYSVPQSDIKAAIEQYSRKLGLPATYLDVAFNYEYFFCNFPLQEGPNRSFYFGFPQGNTKLAMVSAEDAGPVVRKLFENPQEFIGRRVGLVGADLRGDEYAAIFSRVLEREINYHYISRNEYAAYNFPGAEEIANMFETQRLYIPDRQADLEESIRLNPEMQSFESWVSRNRQRFLNHIHSHMEVFVI